VFHPSFTRNPAGAACGGRRRCYDLCVEQTYLEVAGQGVQVALYLALPILAVSLVLGFIISIFQAVTSIQEQTLTFVPKIVVTGLALVVCGPWMAGMMNSFATELFGNLQNYVK
jgi:flagellar biosynthesis protein FliQ